MFNKSSFTKPNDTITRKDVRSVLGSGVTITAQPVPDLTTKAAMQAADARQPDIPAPAPVEAAPAPGSSTSEARLIVGPDVKLKGAEILDCDTLVVEGRVEATMDSRVIRIAEKGSFSGKVSIDIAEIHGTFDGELTARSPTDHSCHRCGQRQDSLRQAGDRRRRRTVRRHQYPE